jgi:hypothetical protein
LRESDEAMRLPHSGRTMTAREKLLDDAPAPPHRLISSSVE